MVWLLFDSPNDGKRPSFISRHIHCKETYSPPPPKNGNLMAAWLKGAYGCLRSSGAGDCIVCWYDFQAVLLYWLGLVLCRRRKIVCLNLLLKDKGTWKNKVAGWMYKVMLNGKDVVASVTSREYGAYIRGRLGLGKEFVLLHDVFHDSYAVEPPCPSVPGTVFMGGKNGRDWDFMLEVAKAMPDVAFHLVMPGPVYAELSPRFPGNVVGKSDLDVHDFMRKMCSCEVVALPLDTEAPAGLIVLFQAAANRKHIIATDTMTTREYLSEGRGCLVPNDVAAWVRAIRDRLGRVSDKAASESLLDFLGRECSEDKYVEVVRRMIGKLQA